MENPLVLKPDAIDVDHQKGALTSSPPARNYDQKTNNNGPNPCLSLCFEKLMSFHCKSWILVKQCWLGSPLKILHVLFVGFLRFHLIRRNFLWSLFFLGGRRLVPRGFRPATPVETAIQLCLGTLILGFFLVEEMDST